MSAVQRFFRRYIVSTVGIVILFLAVNLALFVAIILTGSMSGADTSFSVRDFSDHVVMQDEKWVADDAALSMLQEQSAWAMLLNEDGDVVWQQNLPEKLPRSYTSAEVASFSRWYLEDYPVKIWTRGYLFWLFFAGIRMALHKPLFYERWSRTKLISTVKRT